MQQEAELQDWDYLIKLVTLQQTKCMIKFFKKGRYELYHRAVSIYSNQEVKNCERTIDLFHRVIGTNQSLIEQDSKHWQKHDQEDSSRIIKISEIPAVNPNTEDGETPGAESGGIGSPDRNLSSHSPQQ